MHTSLEYLAQIPKAELHVHLGGSLRFATLIEFAKNTGVDLPSYTEAGLNELIFKSTYANLNDYLASFFHTTAVLLNPEHVEQAGYELALDCAAENITLLEVRFAPQKHLSKHMPTMRSSLIALNKGLSRAAKEINESKRIKEGRWPRFLFGIITCCMRSFSPEREAYFAKLTKRNSLASHASRLQIAANEIAEATILAREEDGLAIVGFDIAGQESNWDVRIFEPAFNRIKIHSIHATAHAGEESRPENIYDAIAVLGAERIGHGLHLFNSSTIPHIEYRNFIENLVHLVHTRDVAIETCPTSNLHTNPALQNSLKNHVLPKLLAHDIPTVICTDNRLISRTTLTKEYQRVAQELNLSPQIMQNLALAGFSYSFFPGTEHDKSAYFCHARTIMDEIINGK